MNPKLTEPPFGTVPLYEAFAQVTAAPGWVQVAFQAWVIRCPAPYVQLTFHDDSDGPGTGDRHLPGEPGVPLARDAVRRRAAPVGGGVEVPPSDGAIA